jgi:hypothetical protein
VTGSGQCRCGRFADAAVAAGDDDPHQTITWTLSWLPARRQGFPVALPAMHRVSQRSYRDCAHSVGHVLPRHYGVVREVLTRDDDYATVGKR